MTHEQFITLETAKLAKQAGFDWETYTMYIDELDGSKIHRYEYKPFNWNIPRKDFEKEGSDNLFHAFINQKKTNRFISAPTQSVLQRWLREVKNVVLLVDFNNDEDCEENERYGVTIYIGNERIVELATYSTYEAALEAGLQECLTLLIEKQ